MPVIAVFTKFDLLHGIAFGELREQGMGMEEAVALAPDHAKEIFRTNDYYGMLRAQKFPPRHFVCIGGEYVNSDDIEQINIWLKEWTKSRQIALASSLVLQKHWMMGCWRHCWSLLNRSAWEFVLSMQ